MPIYSISKYNEHNGHPEPEKFYDQDNQLLNLIIELNKRSQDINSELGSLNININRDLYSNTKRRDYFTAIPETRIAYNLNFLEDGLHPKPLLSRVWLRKLAAHAKSNCWS